MAARGRHGVGHAVAVDPVRGREVEVDLAVEVVLAAGVDLGRKVARGLGVDQGQEVGRGVEVAVDHVEVGQALVRVGQVREEVEVAPGNFHFSKTAGSIFFKIGAFFFIIVNVC